MMHSKLVNVELAKVGKYKRKPGGKRDPASRVHVAWDLTQLVRTKRAAFRGFEGIHEADIPWWAYRHKSCGQKLDLNVSYEAQRW
jgi:hypothetical protein